MSFSVLLVYLVYNKANTFPRKMGFLFSTSTEVPLLTKVLYSIRFDSSTHNEAVVVMVIEGAVG